MRADRKEALRYLGYQKEEPDSRTKALLEEALAELEGSSIPKSIYQEYDCHTEGNVILLGRLTITSASLAKNLDGCKRAVLLAATIGRAADFMLRRYSAVNLAKAVVVQAAGAACIEAYVNEVEEEIRQNAQERGLVLRPRFSPGYGDFALEHQKDIFAELDCGRRLGLILTEGNLMMPSKSVTAVIGLAGKQEETI